MKLWQRLFGKPPEQKALTRPRAATDLPLRPGTTLPIPDWQQCEEQEPADDDEAALHEYWTAIAFGWIDALQLSLGDRHRSLHSANFLLLSTLSPRQNQLTLDACERMRRHILRVLDGVASADGFGPTVVLLFADSDEYYHYLKNYGDNDSQAMSSGVFIDAGYGHFVSVGSEVDQLEPIVAHELTHCLLRHLPLPAWVNEGLAVCCEHALFPHLADPRNALYTPTELKRRHARFWNAETIQQFWSGKSFRRPDIGNQLSYDLAERLTQQFARPGMRLREFLNAAEVADGGVAAARSHLDLELGTLAATVLGPGPWTPEPARWTSGVELGQFRGW